MAVQAQFMFGGLAGCLLPCGGGGLAEEQMQALLSSAATNKAHRYNRTADVASAAQSDLTRDAGAGVAPPPRKRGGEAEHGQYVSSSPAAALLPIPGTHMHDAIAGHQWPPALAAATTAGRLAQSASATTSTSGRPASGASVAGVLAPELRQHGAVIDALVRAECDRMRAGLEQARKRQCLALARAAAAVAAAAAPALQEVEAELAAARRRAADLEEMLRWAAAESQAWCGLARSNGAVAAGLRAAIDAVLLQGAGAGCATGTGTARPAAVEGFGDSGGTDDAQSCCCDVEEQAADTAAATASSSWNGKWACKACGEGEASVLLLPCRHLCLCKACEPRTDACPACLGAKNASLHIAPN